MKPGFFFHITISLSILLSFSLYPSSVFAQNKQSLKKIVIDPGHGGKDPGALKYRYGKHEKDIVLDVSLKLGKLIEKKMPGVEVIYTRSTDVFIELKDRHRIANKASADLFISIHVNATAGTKTRVRSGYRWVGKGSKRRKVANYKTVVNRSTNASGTETYVLGLHRNNQKSRAIEEYGDQVTEEPGMLDPNDPTTQILVAQYTQAFLSRSILFADKVEQNFVKAGRKSYGVKQMGLEVLAGSVMPGVLVELGFINNEHDEKLLNTEEGQQAMANAIFDAIVSYKKDIEKGKGR